MKGWEYLVIRKAGRIMGSEGLNDYGIQGWELVQVVEAYGTLTGQLKNPIRFYIFKRPLED